MECVSISRSLFLMQLGQPGYVSLLVLMQTLCSTTRQRTGPLQLPRQEICSRAYYVQTYSSGYFSDIQGTIWVHDTLRTEWEYWSYDEDVQRLERLAIVIKSSETETKTFYQQ